MIVLLGESCSGKSSIAEILCKKYKFERIVPYTTRPPRQGEIDGIDYHFLTYPPVLSLETEYAEYQIYNNWFYGTKLNSYNGNTCNKVVILTPSGLRQIQRNLKTNTTKNIISFYINVPRRERLIRLLNRGDNIEETYKRNMSEIGQFDGIKNEVNKVISNDKDKNIYQTVNEIIEYYNKFIKLF